MTMGVWFELVAVNGSYYLVAHLNLIWVLVFFIALALWRMIAGRSGGRGRF